MSYSATAATTEPTPELGAWDSLVEPGETYMVLGNSVGHLLYNRDYTVILGRAAETYGVPHMEEQWQQARSAIYKLLGICETLDSDGITLYTPPFPGNPSGEQEQDFHCYESVTSPRLSALLKANQPPTTINLVAALQTALAQYFRRKAEGSSKPNGEIILVLFDGEPENRLGMARAIVEASRHIDQASELRIGLLQIGDSPIAEGFFEMLDHNLRQVGAPYDIVSTRLLQSLDENSLTEFLTQMLTD